jgi:hypothetical protein
VDAIVFEHGLKPLSVPSACLGRLPRFDPTTGKPLANYLMIDDLVSEMLHIKVQYKLDESSFVSMLLSQFSTEAKNFMRSVLGTQGNLTVLPLEQILETARAIFFDVDLEHIHAQSKIWREM